MAGPWYGVYLVRGSDAQGSWAYVSKGDPAQALRAASRLGGHLTFVTAEQSDAEASTTEDAVMATLLQTGCRLIDRHGGSSTPSVTIGALLNPASGAPRQQLSFASIGTALAVPSNLVHGYLAGNIRQSTCKVWEIGPKPLAQLRRLLAAGTRIRVLPIAPGGIVVDACLLTGVSSFPPGHPYAGYHQLILADDPDSGLLNGHYSPVPRQEGVRYLTASGAGVAAFLALP